MYFEPDQIYHLYNRGNNKIPIFFKPENYLFLLRKVKKEWLSYCDICCYCLMPNHFHFMLSAKSRGCECISLKGQPSHLQKLSKSIGKTLSSYTQAINIQNKTSGNLFAKKTKAKCLTNGTVKNQHHSSIDYMINCFHYIHNNPIKSKLVSSLKEWPYSSWLDYYGCRNGTLCNKQLTMEKLGITIVDFAQPKEFKTDEKILEFIW